MGHPTKVQVIQRQNSEQWYVNFPAAVTRALGLNQGEVVEWVIEDRATLVLKRVQTPRSTSSSWPTGRTQTSITRRTVGCG
jgi:hypothetical protein